MSLLQINLAISANNTFFTKPERHTRKHFPEVLTKATDGQYSLVELEQAKLGSDLSNCTWTKLLAPSAKDITHCQTKRLRRIVGVFEQIIDN